MVKRCARPIDARAFAANLLVDPAAILLLPLPHAAFEFIAAELLASDSFGCELPLHDHLRGDARVIRSRAARE